MIYIYIYPPEKLKIYLYTKLLTFYSSTESIFDESCRFKIQRHEKA